MKRAPAKTAALAAAVAVLAGAAAAPARRGAQPHPTAAKGDTCTERDVFFDVTGIELTERMTAHWDYRPEEPPAQATLDTVQTATVSWHEARSTAAERAKHRRQAIFQDLIGACRVPNFRQGRISGKAEGMRYHVDGTWTAGGRSGTCTGDRTTTRSVTGLFIRHSVKTDPPARTVGLKWTMIGPTEVDCPFSALDGDSGGLVARHLRGYELFYRAVETPIAKAKLFGAKVLHLAVDVRGDGQPAGRDHEDLWNDGILTPQLHLTGTITLTRYKSCTFHLPADIGRLCPRP